MQGPRFPSHATQLVPRTELTARPALPNRSPHPHFSVLPFPGSHHGGAPIVGRPHSVAQDSGPALAGVRRQPSHLSPPARSASGDPGRGGGRPCTGPHKMLACPAPKPASASSLLHPPTQLRGAMTTSPHAPPHTCAPIRQPPTSLRLSGGDSSQHCAPSALSLASAAAPTTGRGDASANAPHLLRETLCQTLFPTQTPRTCLPYSEPSLSL